MDEHSPHAEVPDVMYHPMRVLKWMCLEFVDGTPIPPPRNSRSIGFMPVFASRDAAELEYPGVEINVVSRSK